MAKHYKLKHIGHHHKPLRHKLTPEQKAKRKERFKKLTKVMLWLNPATQPIMIAGLIAKKAEERKKKMQAANQAANPQVESIIGKLNVDIAQAGANQGKIVAANTGKLELSPKGEAVSPIDGAANNPPLPKITNNPPLPKITIDQLAEQAAENPTADVNDPSGEGALSDIGDALSAEGGVTVTVVNYDKAISEAKAKANSLTDANARKEAIAEIANIENSIRSQVDEAKTQASKADPMDVSQAKAELAKVNPASVVASVDSPKVEVVEKPDTSEKKAIETPPASQLAKQEPIKGAENGMPTWAWYLGGLTLAGAIAYGIYASKKSQ